MKWFMMMMISLICVDGYAMRAVRSSKRVAPQMRRYSEAAHGHNSGHHFPSFAVAPPDHFKSSVEEAMRKMNGRDFERYAALHDRLKEYAIDSNLIGAENLLRGLRSIEKCLVLDQVDGDRRTLLIKVATIPHLKFMNVLLNYQAHVNVADTYGFNALSINPRRIPALMVKRLIADGLDARQKDVLKRTALHYLAMKPRRNAFREFSTGGEDPSLHEKNSCDVARLLLSEGVQMGDKDANDLSSLDYALMSEHTDMLKVFIEAGADRAMIIERATDAVSKDLLAHCKI